jgi:peptide/nickel transport system permease protein
MTAFRAIRAALHRGWAALKAAPLTVKLSFAFLMLLVACMLFGGLIEPDNPEAQNLVLNVSGPSSAHLLGTNQVGNDVLSQVIAGTRTSVVGPVVVALITVTVGAAFGVAAGYHGGALDWGFNRLADILYALPSMIVIIVLVGVVGGSYWFAVIVLACLSLPAQIRLSRSAAIAQAHLPYVDAARTLGLPSRLIMVRHVLPNILPTVIATFLLDFVGALIGLSGLAYFGLGVPPGTPDWGSLLQSGQDLLQNNPWISLAPGIAIALTAIAATLVGDWLYDRHSLEDRR